MSSIQETVAVLEAFELEDNAPNIESPSPALSLDGESQTNYIDRSAFDTKWVEETTAMSRLRDTLEQGKQFVTMVYTYRGCSKALPQVKGESDPNKAEIHEKTFEVLEPEIQKLKSFRHFQIESVKFFCEMVRKIVAEKRDCVSESFLLYLAKLLDLFALLDALKNMKACLNNDFSFYKRAFGFLRKNMASEDQTAENHQLSLFLANQNAITTAFKTELHQIGGFDDVIAMIVNLCASCMEEERFVLPSEKNALLRVMPYGLFLMDGESPNSPLNVFKSKKVALSRFSKLFKRFPVVPLYGDMQITLEALIKRSPHFDAKAWEVPEPAKTAIEYEIIHQMRDAREQARQFLARYSAMMSEIRLLQKANQPTAPMAERVTNAVRDSIFFLCDWSGKVLSQAAWKYAHPAGAQPLPDGTLPPPSLNDERVYERVVKNNYSVEERFALVECLAMIKSISGIVLKDDGVIAPLLRRCIHDEVQAFIQIRLREMIRNAAKKKRPVRGELMQLRALAADWAGGIEPNDPALLGQKASKDEKAPPLASRPVAPSATQLELIRSMVYSFFAWKSLGKKGAYSDKDFDDDDIKVLKDFYNRSFFYSYLLNFTGTITEATDLADLWYREFYLELSKRLQFPIDMSLPWVLTDNILETQYTAMMEYLLYPLDIYNDAANRALNILHCQFLYDEIEAEVNLAFDQLVYKLCEKIFSHYKQQASSVLLDKPYKSLAELCYPDTKTHFHPQKSRFEPLMRQRHVQLLGRSVDLNTLIAKRMNQFLRQNVDYAISRFEAADLTSIIELEVELKNIRFTHSLLCKYFDLDAWEYIFNEVNESTSLVSFHGRVVLHVIFELVYDLFPGWNYNTITGRFHKTVLSFADDVTRESMPKAKMHFLFGSKSLNYAYGQASQLFAKFFGMPHAHALIRVVGKANLALVIGECLHNVELKISNVLAPYVRELNKAMPPSSKLPLFDYKTSGCFGYFQLKLKDITVYPDLRSEVFQHFKEMGNSIIFLNMLDHAAAASDTSAYIQAAPFLGITPDAWSAVARERATGADPSLTAPLYARISEFAASVASKPGACRAPEQLNDLTTSAWRADKFYRVGDQHISLFKAAMQKLYDILGNVRHEWAPVGGGDSGVIPIESTTEFYRFWSAVQFVCCLPTGANELSPQELFGDGLSWCGITIIHLLQQSARFDLFDFSYYITNVEDASDEPTPATDKNKLPDFFKKVAIARELNTQIFEILRSYYELTTTQFTTFEPPAADTDLSATHTMSMSLKVDLPAAAAPSVASPHASLPSPTVPTPGGPAESGTMRGTDGAPPSLVTPPTLRKPPPLGESKSAGRTLPSPSTAPKPEASPIRARPTPPDASAKPSVPASVPVPADGGTMKPKPALTVGARPQPTAPARKGGPLAIGARPLPAGGSTDGGTMSRSSGPETLPARLSNAGGTMSRGSNSGTVSSPAAGDLEVPAPPPVDALPPPPSRDALPPPPSRSALPPPPSRDALPPPPPTRDALPPPPMRDALPPPPAAPARDALPPPPSRPAVKPPPRDGLPPPPAPPRM